MSVVRQRGHHEHVCGVEWSVDGNEGESWRTSSSSVSPNVDERGEVEGRKRQVSGEYTT